MATAEDFDRAFAAAPTTRRHSVFAQALGLPPEVEPNSFVTPPLLARLARELGVGPGSVLVDLACGRGGPGLVLARDTGASLIGVDFSAVGVAQAGERSGIFVPPGRARFVVGDLAATGLPSSDADAVLCVDAVQFADDKAAAVAEAYRLLRPGGRYVQTNWQATDPAADDVPRGFRGLHFPSLLAGAGFVDVVVDDDPALAAPVTAVFEAALALPPAGPDDEPLRRLQDEARVVLAWPATVRRVVVTATRPG
ncbi:MAG TPA: class I SAM-dependent methyltransferase [Pseudonocardiaceae bacterium]